MNAVKSVQLKFDQFANLPLGSPKLSHTMLFKKPNANVGNCIHIVLSVSAIHQPVVKAHQPSVDRCDGL